MSLSIGTLAGPLLGGVLYQHGGYYSVFGLAFGLIGIDILLRLVLIEKKHAARWLTREKETLSPEQDGESKISTGVESDPSTIANNPPSEIPEKTPTETQNPLRQAIGGPAEATVCKSSSLTFPNHLPGRIGRFPVSHLCHSRTTC